ncbi:phosphatase [Deinococcus malanensis]|uniref:Phosphatase n=1 Tax=Deinococcus malanensis TaxID=1706855 RepID=A0ABQ2F492_9DEIO|nr:phosphatase domain-containing protein [Deinococcus malanensis]GGK40413.1 phosphatase [Deinococcus malanensis]
MKHALLHALQAGKGGLDETFGPLVQHWRRAGPPDLRTYCGFGTPHAVTVKGRVLRQYDFQPGTPSDSAWLNFWRIILRLLSRELSGVPVVGYLKSTEARATTSREGYFELRFSLPEPLCAAWHTAQVTLPDHAEHGSVPVRVVGVADFGIISDLDDTVIRTRAHQLWQMLETVLFENSRTRLPFAGVGELYHALARGPDGRGDNPVFYVSSSPWNLYGLIWRFLNKREVPLGPLLLRDWNLQTLAGSHDTHKLEAIQQMMTTYPDLPFVLIGDSGQEDPEIYREAARRFPGRVRAIYIRNVTGGRRQTEVVKLRGELEAEGVDLKLVPDSLSAAQHAQATGLIAPGALPKVTAAVEEDRAAHGRY